MNTKRFINEVNIKNEDKFGNIVKICIYQFFKFITKTTVMLAH